MPHIAPRSLLFISTVFTESDDGAAVSGVARVSRLCGLQCFAFLGHREIHSDGAPGGEVLPRGPLPSAPIEDIACRVLQVSVNEERRGQSMFAVTLRKLSVSRPRQHRVSLVARVRVAQTPCAFLLHARAGGDHSLISKF